MSEIVKRLLNQAQVTPRYADLFIAAAGEIQGLRLSNMNLHSKPADAPPMKPKWVGVDWACTEMNKREERIRILNEQLVEALGERDHALHQRDKALVEGENWSDAHDLKEAQRDSLADYAREVVQVMAESDGVAGFHRNGDLATWEEVGLFDVPEFDFEDGGS